MKDKNGIVLSRLKDLIDREKSRQTIADKIDCNVSTITKHYNGERSVTAEFIYKYAKFFGVSSDYLLGLTDDPTTDIEKQAICNYTGLSSIAIQTLHSIKDDPTFDIVKVIDFLVREIGYKAESTIKTHSVNSLLVFLDDYFLYHNADNEPQKLIYTSSGKIYSDLDQLEEEINKQKNIEARGIFADQLLDNYLLTELLAVIKRSKIEYLREKDNGNNTEA